MKHHPPSDEPDFSYDKEENPCPESTDQEAEREKELASPVCFANAPELSDEFREMAEAGPPISLPHGPLTLLLLLITLSLYAQGPGPRKLYMPPATRQTYESGLRTWTGRPGNRFWRNDASYVIEATINPRDSTLHGSERVVYRNHSPDTLNTLVVRLLQNIYRNGAARDFPFSSGQLTPGVTLQETRIGGQPYDPQQAFHTSTNVVFQLKHPLRPGDSLVFETGWSLRLPPYVLRMGYCDSSSAFVGYWYPQIAVYDDLRGWDLDDYTGNQEFYLAPADFDVRLRLPAGFLVWATGALQNPSDMLSPAINRRRETAARADTTVIIVSEADLENLPLAAGGVWHFRADDAPDFAFAFSDRFLWSGSSVAVGDRRVALHAVFPAQAAQAHTEVLQWMARAITYFSDSLPAVAFPYPAFTSFNGAPANSGGMEYPMMANNAAFDDRSTFAEVVIHELFHTYAPFLLRTNETEYEWLDEGWTDYLTGRATDAIGGLGYSFIGPFFTQLLAQHFRQPDALPLMAPSKAFPSEAGPATAYAKPALIFGILREVLGGPAFDQATRAFFRRWRDSSPTPYDLFFTFEDVAGQDLSWFWEPWFFAFGYPDLAVGAVIDGTVVVKNLGGLPLPVDLMVRYLDGTEDRLHFNAAVWHEGNDTFSVPVKKKTVTEVALEGTDILDVDLENNQWLKQ